MSEANLILCGDPSSNTIIARVAQKLPVQWNKTSLDIAGEHFSAASHLPALVYPNPLAPGRYVVLNSGLTGNLVFGTGTPVSADSNAYSTYGDGGIGGTWGDGGTVKLAHNQTITGSITTTTDADIAAHKAEDDEAAKRDAARYVRRVRRRLGFSQSEFSERIDVSLDTIRNWEQGKRCPTGAAKALLKVLDKAPEAALAALR
jgi:putative transcriptional regulator